MKITDVKTFKVNTGRQNWLFVKVICDNGLYGWGEASVEGQELSAEDCIHLLANRSVIGEDPTDINKIWRQMYHHGFWKGGFIHMTAISGIDQALWDLNGKIYGVPTYKLLGGAEKTKIRTYTHSFGMTAEDSAKDAAYCVNELGFAGVKCASRELNKIEGFDALLAATREAIGPDKALMQDVHGRCNAAEGIERCKVAAKYNPYFLEEVCPPENYKEYLAVRRNAYSVPLAAGERTYNRWDARPYFEDQCIDYYQPDICHCGGISEIKLLANMAEVYHIKFAPHNPNGPVATAASIAVAAACHNFAILEFASKAVYARSDVYDMDLTARDGFFSLPTKPGLGIELNEEAFEKYPYVDTQYQTVYGEDGTILEI